MSKVVVFVGGNSDIAKATAELMPDDAKIIFLTRDPACLPKKLRERFPSHRCDPSDLSDLTQVFDSILKENEIASVVNFCGSINLKPAGLLSPSDWDDTLRINLTTAFYVAHVATRLIKKNCSLVFFSSSAAHLGLPNHEAIAAAKAGVEGLSRSIAATYAQQNIRSNVIAPGLIETKLSKNILRSDHARSLSLSLHGLSRLGKPEDVARVLIWLLEPFNDWVTGEVIRVDGGLSTTKGYQTR